jgi:inner membrane protein
MAALEAWLLAYPGWIWIGLAAVLLVGELSTGSGYLLWPAASAGVLAVVAFAAPGLNPVWQLLLFAVLTVVSTVLARRYLPHPFRAPAADPLNDTARRLIGHEGQAGGGPEPRVFVDGKEWAAVAEDGAPLAPGARVRVTAVLGGARLKVRAV